MDTEDNNIIDIHEILRGISNTDDEIECADEGEDEDEVIDISDREFIEAIYASDNFDTPCCWLSFSKGVFLVFKDSIEWGTVEKDGITKMIPNYFETVLGKAYSYVR